MDPISQSQSRLERTPFSILDLAPVRQGGTIAETFRNTLDLARQAERWGYKRYWLAEHHNIPGVACSATSVLIGYVAGGTTTIRVGSGGIMLPNHAPLAVAEQFGTLETLYPGRIDLGLGRAPGGDGGVIRAFQRDAHGGTEFPELLAELASYLAPLRPYQRLQAIPGAGTNVPIWLLGSSDFSARLAGRLGLPFGFASHFQPDNLLPALRIYRDSFIASEVLQKPYCMAGVPVIAADTDAEARRLATTAQQKFLKLVQGHPGPSMPPIDSMEGLWNTFERMAVESKLRAAVIGGPERVRAGLEAFLEETGVDELILTTDMYAHEDRLRSYEIVSEIARLAERSLLAVSF
jgi:luciferase family oxidoreductase group 1